MKPDVAGNNDETLSEYSLYFRSKTADQADEDIRSLDHQAERFRTRMDLGYLRRFLKGSKILDFPIGTGRLYPHLLDGRDLYGFDITPVFIERARARYPHLADRFRLASFEDVSTAERFDSVFSFRVLNNIKNFELAVKNVAALLNDGGRWIFTLPASSRHFATLREVLGRHGLVVVFHGGYDAYARMARMPWVLRGLYRRIFLRAVQARLVPFWLFRLVDRLCHGNATYIIVAERGAAR